MHLGSIWLHFFKLKIPLYKNIWTFGGTIPFHNSDAKENIPENSIPSNILVPDLTVYVPWLSATHCFLPHLSVLRVIDSETVLRALYFFSSLTSFPSHTLPCQPNNKVVQQTKHKAVKIYPFKSHIATNYLSKNELPSHC